MSFALLGSDARVESHSLLTVLLAIKPVECCMTVEASEGLVYLLQRSCQLIGGGRATEARQLARELEPCVR